MTGYRARSCDWKEVHPSLCKAHASWFEEAINQSTGLKRSATTSDIGTFKDLEERPCIPG